MDGHAQLKFVMTECSKTQIRLTRPIYKNNIIVENAFSDASFLLLKQIIFMTILQIVVDFINSQSALSPSGSRAALIEFSSPRLTKLVFGFGDHKYAYDVKKKIKNLRYENGKYECRTSFELLLLCLRDRILCETECVQYCQI